MVCSVTTGVMSAGMSSMTRVREPRQGRTGPWHSGAGRQGVLLAAVDVRRRGPAMAGMAGPAAFGLGSSLPGGLDVGRGLPGRGRGVTRGGGWPTAPPGAWPASAARRRRPRGLARRSAAPARPSAAGRAGLARMPYPGCPNPPLPWPQLKVAVSGLQDPRHSAERLQKSQPHSGPYEEGVFRQLGFMPLHGPSDALREHPPSDVVGPQGHPAVTSEGHLVKVAGFVDAADRRVMSWQGSGFMAPDPRWQATSAARRGKPHPEGDAPMPAAP